MYHVAKLFIPTLCALKTPQLSRRCDSAVQLLQLTCYRYLYSLCVVLGSMFNITTVFTCQSMYCRPWWTVASLGLMSPGALTGSVNLLFVSNEW